jgi:Transposase IS116/IS110/IS902 family
MPSASPRIHHGSDRPHRDLDVGRFRSADRLASLAGLTPNEHSSAEHTRRGHISKQGSRWLRWVLVEAATRPQRDPEFPCLLRSDRCPQRREDCASRTRSPAPHALLLRATRRKRLSLLPDHRMNAFFFDVVEARSRPVMAFCRRAPHDTGDHSGSLSTINREWAYRPLASASDALAKTRPLASPID